jgi:AraC-like DNA-binding protein
VTEQLELGSSGIRVSRVRSTGHRISLTENRDVTFLFPRAGALAVRVAGRSARVDRTRPAVARPHARETTTYRPRSGNFEGHVLMLPMADVEALARTTGVHPFLGADVLPVEGAAAARLGDYVAFLLSSLDLTPVSAPSDRVVAGMVSLLRDLVADWLGETPQDVEHAERTPAGVDAARVRRAEEMMRSRIDEPLSIADLARGLGLSLRSLQLAFHTVHGEGPRARLNRIRLDLARARLLRAAPPEKVTTIALDCGFTHLGRFAEAYLRTFGERPSDTLARGRPSRRWQ